MCLSWVNRRSLLGAGFSSAGSPWRSPNGYRGLAEWVFLLYNTPMARPRGSKNTAMVNGRITAAQMEWLLALADEVGGNLSAALRQAITDAQVLEMARMEYERL